MAPIYMEKSLFYLHFETASSGQNNDAEMFHFMFLRLNTRNRGDIDTLDAIFASEFTSTLLFILVQPEIMIQCRFCANF